MALTKYMDGVSGVESLTAVTCDSVYKEFKLPWRMFKDKTPISHFSPVTMRKKYLMGGGIKNVRNQISLERE